jgi:hypothetical protein
VARDEKHKAQVRAGTQARRLAIARLIALHKKEYDQIYAEEAAKLGITPMKMRRQAKIERLKQELADLEGQ